MIGIDEQNTTRSMVSAHRSCSRRCYLSCLLPSGLYRRLWNFPRSCLSLHRVARGLYRRSGIEKAAYLSPLTLPRRHTVFNYDAPMIAYGEGNCPGAFPLDLTRCLTFWWASAIILFVRCYLRVWCSGNMKLSQSLDHGFESRNPLTRNRLFNDRRFSFASSHPSSTISDAPASVGHAYRWRPCATRSGR